MFNFLKNTVRSGIEVNNIAKAINAMNVLSKEIVELLVLKDDNIQAAENTAFLAYICRKGVRLRLENFDIPLNARVIIPSISSRTIILQQGLTEVTMKLVDIAEKLEMTDLMYEIIEGGPAFYAIEKSVPSHIKNQL